MGLRQCDKCSEMVDEAKAFCPACGNALVEEQLREQESNFDTMDSTVQLGQTMYNQMLSDMGLNISKPPDQPEKRIEVLVPETAAAPPPPARTPAPAASSNIKWVLIGAAAVVVVFAMFVVVAAAIYLFWARAN